MYPILLGYMSSRDIAQKDLADILHISRAATCRKLNGQTDFKITEMRTMSDYFGIPMDELFKEDEEEKK